MTTSITADNDVPKLDHFRFWKVQPISGIPSLPARVRLRGLFDSTWWDAEVQSPEYLGNPVDKTHRQNHAPIHHPDLHFVMYRLRVVDGNPATPDVTLTNQFDTSPVTWQLSTPEYLLVPAGKKILEEQQGDPNEPNEGDHFICYRVGSDDWKEEPVILSDQFQKWIINPPDDGATLRLQPRYFCVPAQKKHDEHPVRAITNPVECLTIYWILPPAEVQQSLFVRTADQFGTCDFAVLPPQHDQEHPDQMLAVPSKRPQ